LYPLKKVFFGFNLFKYITFRAGYASLTALFLSLIIAPGIIKFLKRKGFREVIREETPERHIEKAGTPTMGGVIILAPLIISTILWARLDNQLVWVALLNIFLFALLGFIDDYVKVKKISKAGIEMKIKFLGELIISIIIMLVFVYVVKDYKAKYFLYIPFIKHPVASLGLWYIPFGVIVLLATSNAVNLTDGLDGLAIGCSIPTLGTLTIIAYLTGHIKIATYLNIPYIKEAAELTVLGASFVGAALGFLWFNAHPAEVFMGDTGALAIGATMGFFGIILKREILLFLLGGIFVIEALSVIIQVIYFKLTKGKRIFKMSPLHHHFELSGWAESKIIVRFWIISLILNLIGLSTLKIQ